MNKATINQEMQQAYEALSEVGIANAAGEIENSFRGHISSFGAAVTMGSLLPAIAFFSKDAEASVSRSKLMDAVLVVLKKRDVRGTKVKRLYDYAEAAIKGGYGEEAKEEILNATIAIKLSMNLYKLKTN